MGTRSSQVTSQLINDEYAGRSLGYGWNAITLAYEVVSVAGGVGGGGGPATIADGADVAQGSILDAESVAGVGSVIALLKRLRTLLSNPLAVTGTFWQATQPVSLAAAVDVSDRVGRLLGVIASVTAAIDVGDRAARLLGHVTVDNASIPVTDNAGSLTVDAPVGTPLFARLSDGAAALIGQKVMASSLPVVIASDQSAVPVTAPALTKGTQGANGFSTQDLKDAGRVQFSCATVIAGVAGVAVEAVLNMVALRDGVAAAGATTFAVTAAKRLRLTHIVVGFISTAAAVVSVRAALRINPAGAAIVTSPIIVPIAIPSAPAVIQQGGFAAVPLPDGFEFSGAHQFALSHIGSVATYTLWAALIGFEY